MVDKGDGFTKKELKEILDQHSLWLDSDGEKGCRADLTGADLTWANLFEVDLTWAALTGANLTWAALLDANLFGANLDGANLDGAHLVEADLTEATLSRANLSRADLRGAALYRANLTGAKLGPEIRECATFARARVSEDQLAWLCLHPQFSAWVDGLVIVN